VAYVGAGLASLLEVRLIGRTSWGPILPILVVACWFGRVGIKVLRVASGAVDSKFRRAIFLCIGIWLGAVPGGIAKDLIEGVPLNWQTVTGAVVVGGMIGFFVGIMLTGTADDILNRTTARKDRLTSA
jgi:hypothetical protein